MNATQQNITEAIKGEIKIESSILQRAIGSSGSVVETVLDDTFCFSCIR